MESFEEFKNSFAYGSRSDLSFKFLKRLPQHEAAEFLRVLLEEIGHTFDDADLDRIHHLVYEWQVAAYAPSPEVRPAFTYDEGPFADLDAPLGKSRVALLASSGHFAADDDPMPFGVENMTQEEAAQRIDEFLATTPVLSPIHRDIPAHDLRVRHGGYDVRSAAKDHNVSLPRDALVEAEDQGVIGEFVDTMYSFVGATAQGRMKKEALPAWIEALHPAEVDALLLVPV